MTFLHSSSRTPATRSEHDAPRLAWARAGAAALGLVLVLTGCSRAVTLDAAPDAADPLCAKAMVAMPDKVSGESQRDTTAQGTTAWGDDVILKCGIRVQEPVTDPCVNVNGVDWIVKKADEKSTSATPSASSSSASAGAATTQAGQSSAVQTSGGTWQATTYGRSPAFQVTFDADKVPSSTLLVELQSAIAEVPQQKKCKSVDDTVTDR